VGHFLPKIQLHKKKLNIRIIDPHSPQRMSECKAKNTASDAVVNNAKEFSVLPRFGQYFPF